jgi:hypothetical protein
MLVRAFSFLDREAGLEVRLERGWNMNGFPEKILLATDGLDNTTLSARLRARIWC